jgi:predicted RecB family nuclease
MERRDTIEKSTADVVARRYIQPTGYHWTEDEKPRRQDFRLAWIGDHIEKMREERRERAKGAS